MLEPGALSDAQGLTEIIGDDDLQAMYLLGWLRWYRCQAAPEGQGRQDLDAAIRMFTPCFINAVGGLPGPLLAVLAREARPTANALLKAALGAAADGALVSATVNLWQRILSASPASDPDRAGYLSNLGLALKSRFEHTGTLADLDAAIEVGQAAVTATPNGHSRMAGRLSNLEVALRARYGRAGALADLDSAIEVGQAAVTATPPDDPEHPMYQSNLGNALRDRFERAGAQADLDAAIEAAQAAVNATPPGHPYQAGCLSNLAAVLLRRFERAGAQADLDAAAEAAQAAVNAAPPGHPDRAGMLSNLGSVLRAQFEQTRAQADLDAAVEAARAAVDATPATHSSRALYLSNLGRALWAQSERTEAPADHEAAVSAFAEAAELDSAAASVRIDAARAGASLAAKSEPGRAAGLLEMAVRLLPDVAPRQLARSDQQAAIGGFAGLAGDAAALALTDRGENAASSERAAQALRLLEAGRAVLLSQALDTRSDLTDLRDQHPDLAARFTELRDGLDQPGDTSQGVTSRGLFPAMTRREEERRHLADEFTAILAQIRALEAFASFGLPPAMGELLAQAEQGPVVTFNVSAYRSDALLLTGDGIISLGLPGVAQDNLIGQVNSFHRAVRTAADPRAGSPDRIAAQKKLFEILGWLWDNAAGPVLHALGYDQPPPPGVPWPRVWWAPGGLVGLLPVHAAGHHTQPVAGDQARQTVMDRVISSYTPTIRALRYARQHGPEKAPAGHALIVAMPVTPGLPGGGELPNVLVEANRVRALLPAPVLLVAKSGTLSDERASGSSDLPTKANVFAHLPGCPVAHFACHGASDPTDPSKSLLLLDDYDRDPLTVASLGPVNLDHAQLAYLSACSTAFTSATTLVDEAIHLTTAFQLAGFPHVIGTLWEINDALAAELAEAFYTALRTGPDSMDTSQAALALHEAVRVLRDKMPATPSLWAAYLHAGT